MDIGYPSAFSLDTCFSTRGDMGYGLASLVALWADSSPLGMPNHIPYLRMIHWLASVKPWLGKKSPRLGPKPSKPWNFFHDFLFPSTEIIVMQCILSVESFSWGTNCHPSMIGNYRKSEIRGCVVSQSLKHSALFAHLLLVYTFHMLSHLSKVFTVNFIKHRTLWLILNRAGQFFYISK